MNLSICVSRWTLVRILVWYLTNDRDGTEAAYSNPDRFEGIQISLLESNDGRINDPRRDARNVT